MIFGRSRAKAQEFEPGNNRSEQETLKRWQDIAAEAFQGGITEFQPHQDVAFWPAANERIDPGSNTIRLTNLAPDETQLQFNLTERAEEEEAQSLPPPPLTIVPPRSVQPAAAPTQFIPPVQAAPLPQPVEPPPPPIPAPPPSPAKVPPSDLTLSVEEDLRRRFGANIRSALGSGTVIEGTFRFDSPVCIDGTLLGEVSSTSVLIVGEEANVRARIKVGSLIVMGTVIGDVEATDLVEIRATGHLDGDILAKRLSVEEGGWFDGACNMLD